MLKSRLGKMQSGSSSRFTPRPWQAGHAPCGVLNENVRGSISGRLMPQNGQAKFSENRRSSPVAVSEIMTVLSPSFSAVSIESVKRLRNSADCGFSILDFGFWALALGSWDLGVWLPPSPFPLCP